MFNFLRKIAQQKLLVGITLISLIFVVSAMAFILIRKGKSTDIFSRPAKNSSAQEIIVPSTYNPTTGEYINSKYGFSFSLSPTSQSEFITCIDKPLKESNEMLAFTAPKNSIQRNSCDFYSPFRYVTIQMRAKSQPCDSLSEGIYNQVETNRFVGEKNALVCEKILKKGATSSALYPGIDPEYELEVQIPQEKYFIVVKISDRKRTTDLEEVLQNFKLFGPEKKD